MDPQEKVNQPSEAPLVHDIAPPTSKPSGAEVSGSDLIQAEITHGIPVKQPVQQQSTTPAPSSIAPPSSSEAPWGQVAKKDPNSTDNSQQPISKAKTSIFKKNKPQPSVPAQPKKHKPVFVALAAFIVACGLAVAAFYAFKQSDNDSNKTTSNLNNPATSSITPPAKDTSVNVSDLDDLSTQLSSKLNTLNDTQEFGASDLSDQTLGL